MKAFDVAATEVLKLVENFETVERFKHINNNKYNKMASDVHGNVSKIKHMSIINKVRDVESNFDLLGFA
jgi:hypothetical protein